MARPTGGYRIRTDKELDVLIEAQNKCDKEIYEMLDMFYKDVGEKPTVKKIEAYRDTLESEKLEIVRIGLCRLKLLGTTMIKEWEYQKERIIKKCKKQLIAETKSFTILYGQQKGVISCKD